MKRIGSTFGQELIAAGLGGLPFHWTDEGEISFDACMTKAQKDAVMAVYVAHNPDAENSAKLTALIVSAVQGHLDATAKNLGYDDIFSAVTYADEPSVPKFQTEGQALRAWRSLVWEKCYAELARVVSGERTIPTPEEAIAELPVFVPPGEA